MSQTSTWSPVEGTVEEILEQVPRPLQAMRESEIPCVIIRKAFPSDHCAALMERFYERDLLYDPRKKGDGTPRRVDIGTSLGHHANDPDQFYEHSQGTHDLFASLFEGYEDPVQTLYGTLQKILPDKQVMVAREPDGRLYGPSIFRTYHEGLGHGPHYDSVSKRSKRYNFAVSRFHHQYAGVLCFQNSEQRDDSGQGVLYRAPMGPELQTHLEQRDFHDFAEEQGIERATVHLEPGDLYFFYSETIHEVPSVVGSQPRCVLASFIGYSEDDPEVYLWS
jgi:hypothetical protein